MTIGKKIQQARMKSNFTQAQLAHMVGCGRLHITKLENNVEYPSLYLLKKIAQELDMRNVQKAIYVILL